MRTVIAVMVMLGFVVLASGYGTGCRQSTKENIRDDKVGPSGSGPYPGDIKETSEIIVSEIKRHRVIENFKAKYGDAPIVALIRPVNHTRFPEVQKFVVEDLLDELSRKFSFDDIRFVQRDKETLSEIEREKLEKEAGEVTDRTGRRTRAGADFFLRSEMTALSRSDGAEDDDTIKYTFQFVDSETSLVMFRASNDIRRVSSRKVIYR